MTKINSILIVGDSFVEYSNGEFDWPNHLRKLLGVSENNFICEGYPGKSFWPIRKSLIDNLQNKTPDLLIICHTNYSRIPCPSHHISENYNGHSDKIFTKWYEKYFLEEFYIWVKTRWFEELDNLLPQYNIPYVIHFHNFFDFKYIFKYGITSKEILFSLQGHFEKLENPTVFTQRKYHNHFSNYGNLYLAEKIYEGIKQLKPYTNEKVYDFNFLPLE